MRDTSRTQAAPQVQFQLTNRKLMIDPVIPGVPVIHYSGGGYLAALNAAIAAIATTGNPFADLAVNAIKAAVLGWANTLQPMGDLKSRVEGPVPLPP